MEQGKRRLFYPMLSEPVEEDSILFSPLPPSLLFCFCPVVLKVAAPSIKISSAFIKSGATIPEIVKHCDCLSCPLCWLSDGTSLQCFLGSQDTLQKSNKRLHDRMCFEAALWQCWNKTSNLSLCVCVCGCLSQGLILFSLLERTTRGYLLSDFSDKLKFHCQCRSSLIWFVCCRLVFSIFGNF